MRVKSKCRLSIFIATIIILSTPTTTHNTEHTYFDNTEFVQVYVEPQNEYIGIFEVTAYAPHDNISGMCNDGNPNSTATGTYPTAGRTIAVDPNVIEYGTVVYIEGIGERVAEDCGGMIRQNCIDLMVDTYDEAMRFGRQKLKVWIVR